MEDVVLVGIQGSGKGTQAELLVKNFGFHHFETGGELRRIAKEDSPLGRKIKEIMDKGEFVSSALTMDLIQSYIDKLPPERRILIDGTPRFEEQRKDLDELFKKNNRKYKVLFIELSKEEAIRRVLERGKIQKRSDDNPETIERRIQNFFDHTTPLLEEWEKQGVLVRVNGENSIEKVYGDIIKALNLS